MTFQQLRRSKFRTAKEFAEKIDIPTTRVQKWENGSCVPRSQHWRKIAEVLNVTIDELLNCFEEEQK